MNKGWTLRCLPLVMALSFVTAAAPAARAAEDVGQQMEREYGVVTDNSGEGAHLNEQLDRVVRRITGAINEDSRYGNFRLRSATLLGGRSAKGDKVVNAFALPDGRIYVTLGLMRALQDSRQADDELAFVVGHEVVHVVQKHSKGQQSKAIQAGLLSVLLGAVTRSDAIGQVAGMGANAYVSSFGRKDEYRADKGGLEAMHRAGYDPDAAAMMLKRLQQKGEDDNRLVNGLFGSHPLTANRIKRVQQMSRDLEAGRPISETEKTQAPAARRRR